MLLQSNIPNNNNLSSSHFADDSRSMVHGRREAVRVLSTLTHAHNSSKAIIIIIAPVNIYVL